MARRLISSWPRLFLAGLLLSLVPILSVHAEPDTPAAGQATGSISGRVTDVLTGLPISDVTVEAVNLSIETKTDAGGRYRLANVPAGDRYVLFDSDRYAYEYYVDAPRMFLAQTVKVVAGEETTGIDAALAPAGRITGRVTDQETGAALAGVRVRAGLPQYRPSWIPRVVREAVTGADGRYALEGLWTAVYSVECVDEAGDHATQTYGTGVGVLVGEDAAGIDIALQHEGHIAGQVTDLAGAPLAGVTVSVLALDTGGGLTASAETDANGQYEATALPAGEYWLHFEPGDRLHAASYYGGGVEDWTSQRVKVEVGRTTGGIDQQLPELAAITGRVTDALTGEGLRGMDVYLDWYSEYREPDVETRPDGTYIIPTVAPGKHTVWIHDPNGTYRDGQAMQFEGEPAVMVQEGRISRQVNAALDLWTVSLRKITGTVTDVVTGQPLPGIRVTMYDCWRSYHLECWDVGVVFTDAAGKYAFYDPGSAWGINFYDPSEVYLYKEAPNFRLPGPDETVVIDAALQKYDRVYGGIAGKVTARVTGEPMAGLFVYVLGADGFAFTAADGTYQIRQLPPGRYKVHFNWNSATGRYAGRYFGGDTLETAAEVEVRAGEVTPGIDGELDENGHIAGTIRSAMSGQPVTGGRVQICNTYTCDYPNLRVDGTYLSGYLPPGPYWVQAQVDGYQLRFYRDADTWDLAEPVTVTVAVTTPGIDIAVPEWGHITGRVTDAQTGEPIEGIEVARQGWSWGAKTGADGRYDLGSLPEGVYQLHFEDEQQRYAPSDAPDLITVTIGQPATFDARLTSYGFITGRVTAAESGEPLGGIEIRAGSRMLWTDSGGNYKIGPLPDGDYQVRFWDPGLLRRMDYSAKVTVKAGETTAGVDHGMILLGIARGRVIDADTGAAIPGVKLSGRGEWPIYNPVYTDAEGHYELRGLNDGTYSLDARDSSHLYIDGLSEKLAIQAGQVIDAPDIKLKRWGEFGGTVTDALTGEPVAGVWVMLYQPTDWGEWYVTGSAVTGPDGMYRIRQLYDETVWPVFSDPQARYHSQSYGGGKSLLDAQTAAFKRGTDLLSIDAALARLGEEPPPASPQRQYLPLITAP